MSEYGHSHERSHEHTASSPEEVLALLKYMLEHNRHHAEELHDLAHQVPEDVEKILHESLLQYEAGNEKLAEAVGKLTKE